jgi:membrane associated rhomboid family serine protease
MSYSTARFAFGYELTPWVKRLLVATTGAFFLARLASFLFDWPLFSAWFSFAPGDILTRPWGVVTYMFVHGDFWHLLMNMLGLFFFGPPLESRWGGGSFLRYYFVCGVGGVALSFIFASSSAIIGASAAIYGLLLAFAWYWPNAPIYLWGIFPIKAKWLIGGLFVLTFVSAFSGTGGGIAHFAHLGGLLAGIAYLKIDGALPAGFDRLGASPPIDRVGVARKDAVREHSVGKVRDGGGIRISRREEDLLDEVDRILDKISERGMAALTDEERGILDEVSRRRRSN